MNDPERRRRADSAVRTRPERILTLPERLFMLPERAFCARKSVK